MPKIDGEQLDIAATIANPHFEDAFPRRLPEIRNGIGFIVIPFSANPALSLDSWFNDVRVAVEQRQDFVHLFEKCHGVREAILFSLDDAVAEKIIGQPDGVPIRKSPFQIEFVMIIMPEWKVG